MITAGTHLILKLWSPMNIGERSRWESIADFDGGHCYLQKRFRIMMPCHPSCVDPATRDRKSAFLRGI